jgi:hypothetical protein
LLERVKREKFIRREAERAGVTEKHLLEFHEVVPCECGKRKCKGWQLVWKFGAKRRREGNE